MRMPADNIPDILASRYATPEMRAIWSPRGRIQRGREFWVAVLKAQRACGVPIPLTAIKAYERAIGDIDLESIERRERRLRHDNLAEIEEFNALAGYELIHLRLTTRDKNDNVEQMQILESLALVRARYAALLARLRSRSLEWAAIDVAGRTHLMPAQVTTLGKRLASIAEEALRAFTQLEQFIDSYPLRGITGPVGTKQDLLELLGSAQNVRKFERSMAAYFKRAVFLESVGQIYPRSLDFEVVSVLNQLAAGPSNFALLVRLSAGLGSMQEGFAKDQKGSSAMPHKRNARTCERIGGLRAILGGYLAMTHDLLGTQWFEGDVSCSVVRRVALPDSFFAIDAMCEATLTVLDEMQVIPRVFEKELAEQLPFLASTRILGAAVEAGMGREHAHSLIKKHALTALRDLEQGKENSFIARLEADPAFPVPRGALRKLVRADHGLAAAHVQKVARKIEHALEKYPGAKRYRPHTIR